jgi:acyl carrier protein phosphodiesterase
MVGNFIADGVKGKKYEHYDEEIARGILMHRAIDTFTDSSEVIRNSKRFFKDRYGLFASVIVDVFYDHFLASNWHRYSEVSLEEFADRTYGILESYHSILPQRYQHMLPYMKSENWLLNYAHLDGIRRTLRGMSQRIRNHPGIENSPEELVEHYDQLQDDFILYFPQLQEHISPWTKPA